MRVMRVVRLKFGRFSRTHHRIFSYDPHGYCRFRFVFYGLIENEARHKSITLTMYNSVFALDTHTGTRT